MKKILVVDDETSVRTMLVAMVKPDGYEMIEASNGEEAMAAFNDVTVDLVITDIVMPVKNGIDLTMELKKTHPDIPVIAISGGGGISGRYDYLEIAKLVGAKNILKKPFTRNELCSVVAEILEEK